MYFTVSPCRNTPAYATPFQAFPVWLTRGITNGRRVYSRGHTLPELVTNIRSGATRWTISTTGIISTALTGALRNTNGGCLFHTLSELVAGKSFLTYPTSSSASVRSTDLIFAFWSTNTFPKLITGISDLARPTSPFAAVRAAFSTIATWDTARRPQWSPRYCALSCFIARRWRWTISARSCATV